MTFRFIGALYFPCPQSLRKKKTKQKKAMQSCPCCGDYSLSLPVVTAGLWGQMSVASANGSEVQELETEQAAAVTSEPRPALAVGCMESGVGSPSPLVSCCLRGKTAGPRVCSFLGSLASWPACPHPCRHCAECTALLVDGAACHHAVGSSVIFKPC